MSVRLHPRVLTVLAVCCLAAVSATAAQEETTQAAVVQPAANPSPYPVDVCPISGKKLGKMGRIVVRTYEGREVRLCCASCAAKFDADPQAGLQKLDERIIAAQKPEYPLTLCPVSGEKLGEMGEPVDYVYDNQLIRFCCPACVADFTKQPAVYMGRLQAAYAVQRETRGVRPAPHPAAGGDHQEHDTHVHH
ncbi:MAG: hypothetical protein WDA75_03780 [Candidatus Latescibacterota bacterium]|jgi:YHS domain-containing protein